MNLRLGTSALAASLVVLLAACSSSDGPDGPDPADPESRESSTSGPQAPAGFPYDATRACTAALNENPPPPDGPAGFEMLEAIVEDEEPSADQLTEWAARLDEDLDRLQKVRGALAELESADPQEQEAWRAVVESVDPTMEAIRERGDLLRSGDWQRIRAKWQPGAVPADPGQEAVDGLASLDLGATDCEAVYALGLGPEPEHADFVAQVATACTTIANRRHADGFSDHLKISLEVLADLVKNDELSEELPSGLEDSVSALHEEWELTVADLESVTAEGPDPAAWDDVLAAAAERVEVFADRLDAVRAGDRERIAEAFRPDWEYPGLDYPTAGVTRLACRQAGG